MAVHVWHRSAATHFARINNPPTELSAMNPHQVRIVAVVLVAILVLATAATLLDGLLS